MSVLKNFLLASEENNYNPGILKPTTIGVLVGFFLLSNILNNALLRHVSEASDLTAESIIAAINNERALRNLVTLSTDSRLVKAAEYKAQDMVNRKYFSHTDPSGNYIWPTITAYGYSPYVQLGENLAIEFSNTESLVQAWMNSPTHRANVLNEGFRDQGMGVSFGSVNNGEYSSSIANTFGTLVTKKALTPVVAEPAPLPEREPTPTPSTKPATTPQPTPTKPVIKPSPVPVPTTTSTTPTTTPVIASTTPLTQSPTSTPGTQKKIEINKNSLNLKATVKGANIIVSMEVSVSGSPDTVVATVADKTIMLEETTSSTAATTYGGQVKLPLDSKTESSDLQIFAQDRYGQADTYKTPFKDVVQLPKVSAVAPRVPASFNRVQFDFYTINRYVTLIVGIILLLFMLTDVKIILQRKFTHLDKRLNNFVLLALALIVIGVMYWL